MNEKGPRDLSTAAKQSDMADKYNVPLYFNGIDQNLDSVHVGGVS